MSTVPESEWWPIDMDRNADTGVDRDDPSISIRRSDSVDPTAGIAVECGESNTSSPRPSLPGSGTGC